MSKCIKKYDTNETFKQLSTYCCSMLHCNCADKKPTENNENNLCVSTIAVPSSRSNEQDILSNGNYKVVIIFYIYHLSLKYNYLYIIFYK